MKDIIAIENLPEIIQDYSKEKWDKNVSAFSKKVISSVKIENNGFLKLISQVPIIRHALKFEKGFIAIIPEELKKGLKDGTLKMMQGKDGSLISEIVDSSGKIIRQVKLKEFTKKINPVEISQAMNQMCMQMALEEIQKTLMDLRLETNAKLDEILLKLHGNRVTIPTVSIKQMFEYYQEKKIKSSDLLVELVKAKTAVLTEIKDNISILREGNYTSITQEKNKEIQTRIRFILDSLGALQELYQIEIYMFRADGKKVANITAKYTESLLAVFTKENIQFLDAYSDFAYLNLKENIWETKLSPMIENLLEQEKHLHKYQFLEAKN